MLHRIGGLLARLRLPPGSLTQGDKLFIVLLALLPIALIIASVAHFQREYVPPLVYSQDIYSPDSGVLCPGEALRYHTQVQILKDADVFTIRSIRAPITGDEFGEGHRTVAQISTTYASVDEGDAIRADQEIVVPALPPGSYYLVVSSNSLAGRPVSPARYRVPFMVPENCPTDEPAETSALW